MMLRFQLITPETVIVDEEVNAVSLPTEIGEIGILPRHMHLLTSVVPGELTVQKENKKTHYATGSGFAEVFEGRLTVLTDMAVDSARIDEHAEEEARLRAQAALAQRRSDEEIATISAQLERSLIKLRVKRRRL